MLFSFHFIFFLVVQVYSDFVPDLLKEDQVLYGRSGTVKKKGAGEEKMLVANAPLTADFVPDLLKGDQVLYGRSGTVKKKGAGEEKTLAANAPLTADFVPDLLKGDQVVYGHSSTVKKKGAGEEKTLVANAPLTMDFVPDLLKGDQVLYGRSGTVKKKGAGEEKTLVANAPLTAGNYRVEVPQTYFESDLPKGDQVVYGLSGTVKKKIAGEEKTLVANAPLTTDIEPHLPNEFQPRTGSFPNAKKGKRRRKVHRKNATSTNDFKSDLPKGNKVRHGAVKKERARAEKTLAAKASLTADDEEDSFPKCGFSQVPIVKGNALNDKEYEKESHLIIGGQTARRGSWPWMVFLEFKKKFYCGGSIITNQWILTAGHCIEPFYKKINQVTATLGAHVRSEISPEKSTIRLKRGIVHPDFQAATLKNDIGLVELEKPILFDINKSVIPVCLPAATDEIEPGTMTYVMGWGLVIAPSGPASDILKQAMVPVFNQSRCVEIIKGEKSAMLPHNSTFCTHYEEGGHNSCMGDSGSPLVVARDNLWIQYGIVSWGMRRCATKTSPSVFTKVSAFIPWIRQTTNYAKITFAEET